MVSFQPVVAPLPAAHVEADAAVIDAIVGVDRMIATLTASKARLVEFARANVERTHGRTSDLPEREFLTELAAALRIPERTADRLVSDSWELSTRLPATLVALEAGRLTPRHAAILLDCVAGLDDVKRAEVESRALGFAHRPTGEFARTVKRLCARQAPETAIERHATANHERRVACEPAEDGMAWLSAYLPAPEAVAVFARLDDAARSIARDGETMVMIPQLRADLLIDALLGTSTERATRLRDVATTVVVTVPVMSLLGRSEEPAELEGHGPIDLATALELAAEAPHLRRMLVDPESGVALSLSRTRYRPGDELRLWLRLRDGRCRFPGCVRRPAASDIDHTTAWAVGGETDHRNLAHLCRRHHTLKHGSRWRIEARHPDGTLDWVSPQGRRHRSRPATHLLATDPGPPG